MEKHKYPVTTLTNGLRVANFSSAHEYHFVDGSVLPACSAERCEWLSMEPVEVTAPSKCGRWVDILIRFKVTPQVLAQLLIMQDDDAVDVVLAPRVVVEAVDGALVDGVLGGESNSNFDTGPLQLRAMNSLTKLRTNRVADRVKKLNHIDRFCM